MYENFAAVIKSNSAEWKRLEAIDPARLPQHIAIIMDGNGRWAKKRGRPRIFGHRAGADSVRSIIDTCTRLEVKAVTLYAFSTENWKRPKTEISGLMQMLKRFLRSELDEVHGHNIRFQAIGNIAGLAEDVQKEIAFAMEKTAGNTGTIMSVALNYGGRAEIVEACRKSFIRATIFSWKPASPAPIHSSITRMSLVKAVVTANASRIASPCEYVCKGMSR